MAKKPRNTDKADHPLRAPDLSRVYRAGTDEQPPSRLDAAILAEARKAVSAPSPSRWNVPLSTAAVVVLSVALVVFMARETPLQERALMDSAPSSVTDGPKAKVEAEAKMDRRDAPRNQTPQFAPSPKSSVEITAEEKKESRSESVLPAAPASPARERTNDAAGSIAGSAASSTPLIAKQAAATIDLQVGSLAMRVEVASTGAALERGLMYRDSLAADAGMLFIFPARELDVCMWMKDTRLPLSAAFIDRDGKVLNIADMQPFTTTVHCAEGGQARFVIEANQGAFAAAGIKRGSRIRGLPTPPN